MNAEEKSGAQRLSAAKVSRLKLERERRGWTQGHLAQLIGSTQTNVSRWESGAFPGLYYRQKLSEVFGKSIEELGLAPEVEEEHNEQIKKPSNLPDTLTPSPHLSIWNVPYRRNPFFTGREELLSSLATALSSSKTAALTQAQAISGLGGIGKTQIAVEYAYRYRDHYQAILWVTASSRDALLIDFVALATLLDLPERHEQDQDMVVRAVKQWLTTYIDWLLILDNLDDPKAVTDFLPNPCNGSVLLTTRLQALGSLAQGIEVKKMDLTEAVTFLLRRTKLLKPDVSADPSKKEQWAQAVRIVTALDGLPLALDQAGAYIEETHCDFAGYLDLYQIRRKDLLLRRGTLPADHPEPVAATWSLSFQRIEQESLAAANLLRLFAFLSPDAIPEEIISAAAAELTPTLDLSLRDPFEINAAIEVLLRYSLLERTPEAKLLSIHRLVQAVLKDGMDESLQYLWAERTIRIINRVFPEVELKTWTQCQRYLPHAQVSAINAEKYGLAFPEAARLFNEAAIYLAAHAQYAQAEALLQKALAIRHQVLEPVHPDIARTLHDLGDLYRTQGRYNDARPLLQQALAIRQQVLGAEHPTTAITLNKLATLSYARWEVKEAEQLYLQALHIQQSLLEPDHPDIAQTLNNLTDLYANQGKYGQAASYYAQVLSSQEKVLGLEHPDVAQTLNKLAQLYRWQGEYSKAEYLYKDKAKALRIQEQVLGTEHPDVAQRFNSLARLYRAKGEYSKAEDFYLHALEIRQKQLSDDHPDVAQSLYSLGELYNSQGKYRQAAASCEHALSIQERQLGASHPTVAATLTMLAKIYLALGDFVKAEDLNNRALKIRLSASGPDHPQIAFIKNNQAEIYHAQGRNNEARLQIDEALHIHEQALGPDHPHLAYSLSNLAKNYLLEGDYAQAEAYFKKALAIREQSLGPEHPHIASTYHDLAKLYFMLNRYEEAETLYRKALIIFEKTLGPEYPPVAANLEDYALLMHKMKREKRAKEFEERAQSIKAKQIEAVD